MGKNKSYTWYLNGKFVPAEKAVLPVSDLGLQRGWGVFDYCRTYGGKPFRLEDHLDRFFMSASAVALKVPKTKRELIELTDRLLARNKLKGEAGIKFLLTAGGSKDGVVPNGPATLAIIVFPMKKYSLLLYRKGASLAVCRQGRSYPEVKTLNYLAAMVALKEAKKNGFDDILYLGPHDEILESSRSNFFVFIGDNLVTPEEGILAGITRKIVCELAGNRYNVRARQLRLSEMRHASEAFITSSDKEIMPVVRIGKNRIGKGLVGERTKQLMVDYKELTNG